MRKIRIAALLLAAALVASAFAGCGETKAQTGETKNGRGTMAKVVSLDGDQLTVILADMPDGGAPANQPGQSEPNGQPGQNDQSGQPGPGGG